MRDIRAFTLVELLVTVLLLSVGILAFATTAALASRMITTGHHLAALSGMASRQVASWQGGACGTSGSGERVEGPFHLRWTAGHVAGSVRHLAVRVAVRHRGRTLHATLSAVHVC